MGKNGEDDGDEDCKPSQASKIPNKIIKMGTEP